MDRRSVSLDALKSRRRSHRYTLDGLLVQAHTHRAAAGARHRASSVPPQSCQRGSHPLPHDPPRRAASSPVAFAIGQQHNDGRPIDAFGHRCRRRLRCRCRLVGRGWRAALGEASSNTESREVSRALPMAVPRCGDNRLIEETTASLSTVGACTRKALSLEEQPQFSRLTVASRQRTRGRLRCFESLRLEIVGAHAARYVDCEDYGAFIARQCDHRHGLRKHDGIRRQGNQEQCGRQMAAQPGPRPNASFTSDRLA